MRCSPHVAHSKEWPIPLLQYNMAQQIMLLHYTSTKYNSTSNNLGPALQLRYVTNW